MKKIIENSVKEWNFVLMLGQHIRIRININSKKRYLKSYYIKGSKSKSVTFNYCGKVGHIIPYCFVKKSQPNKTIMLEIGIPKQKGLHKCGFRKQILVL